MRLSGDGSVPLYTIFLNPKSMKHKEGFTRNSRSHKLKAILRMLLAAFWYAVFVILFETAVLFLRENFKLVVRLLYVFLFRIAVPDIIAFNFDALTVSSKYTVKLDFCFETGIYIRMVDVEFPFE